MMMLNNSGQIVMEKKDPDKFKKIKQNEIICDGRLVQEVLYFADH